MPGKYQASHPVTNSETIGDAPGETNIPAVSQPADPKDTTMGDRSPKSVQKSASQKQAKTNVSNQKKQAVSSAHLAARVKAGAKKK